MVMATETDKAWEEYAKNIPFRYSVEPRIVFYVSATNLPVESAEVLKRLTTSQTR